MPLKYIVSAAMLVCVAACNGAQFSIPQISEADVNRASLAVSHDNAGLIEFYRTDEQYEQTIANVSNRLRNNVQPFCEFAKTKRCFFVVQYSRSNDVNAYTDAENRITLNRGLLRYLETEDEVAAVVGHEMGHVIAEHLEEKRQNAVVGSIIGGLLYSGARAATGAYNTPYSNYRMQQDINEGMAVGAAIGALSFSKEEEREADLISAYLVARAKYNLEAAGRVFKVLARMSGTQTKAPLFATHPAGPERVAAWDKAIVEVKASPDKLPHSGSDTKLALASPHSVEDVETAPTKMGSVAAAREPGKTVIASKREWSLTRQVDGCGQTWSADIVSFENRLTGHVWRGDAVYDVSAPITNGGTQRVLLSRSTDSLGVASARFLRMTMDISENIANGTIWVESGGQLQCSAQFRTTAVPIKEVEVSALAPQS